MKHIILIGFKNVGKSAVGRVFARHSGLSFVDLDEQVERTYREREGEAFSCRQIVQRVGVEQFRKLEHDVLQEVLKQKTTCVIAAGGGMPLYEANRTFLRMHTVIQVTAAKNIVYERIMVNGRPAFFPPDEAPLQAFNRIWAQREPVYARLAQGRVENTGSIAEAVTKLARSVQLL